MAGIISNDWITASLSLDEQTNRKILQNIDNFNQILKDQSFQCQLVTLQDDSSNVVLCGATQNDTEKGFDYLRSIISSSNTNVMSSSSQNGNFNDSNIKKSVVIDAKYYNSNYNDIDRMFGPSGLHYSTEFTDNDTVIVKIFGPASKVDYFQSKLLNQATSQQPHTTTLATINNNNNNNSNNNSNSDNNKSVYEGDCINISETNPFYDIINNKTTIHSPTNVPHTANQESCMQFSDMHTNTPPQTFSNYNPTNSATIQSEFKNLSDQSLPAIRDNTTPFITALHTGDKTSQPKFKRNKSNKLSEALSPSTSASNNVISGNFSETNAFQNTAYSEPTSTSLLNNLAPSSVNRSTIQTSEINNHLLIESTDHNTTPDNRIERSELINQNNNTKQFKSFEAIILHQDKYACVVKLRKSLSTSEVNRVQNLFSNLKIVTCQKETSIITLFADQKQIVIACLKELYKTYGRLNYLPAYSNYELITQAFQSIDSCDDTLDEKLSLLASLKCSSGLVIELKCVSSNDILGARFRSVGLHDIHQSYFYYNIIGISNNGRFTTDTNNSNITDLHYWDYYIVSSETQDEGNKTACLIVPHYNKTSFSAQSFKNSLINILYSCNQLKCTAISFPIIGNLTLGIPANLSAQALLYAIDQFSDQCTNLTLKQVNIIINNRSKIEQFRYYFITPIRHKLKSSPNSKKITENNSVTEETTQCSICLDDLHSENNLVKELTKCKHQFHENCINRALSHCSRCPLCLTPVGTLQGSQPDNGQMTYTHSSLPLPGHPECGHIMIKYSFAGGTQGPQHPYPGKPYKSTARTAFLPDNDKGKYVLNLLRKSFEQKITFTIGRSVTSGKDNVITWNDIHHKTSMYGGASSFGYPDPSYLDRVIGELKAKGIE